MVGNPDIERQLSALELMNAAAIALRKALPKLWSNYGPVILSQRSETSFGSHPCRVISVSYE
jgi:hypothetical protein